MDNKICWHFTYSWEVLKFCVLYKNPRGNFFPPGRNKTIWQIGGLAPLTSSLGTKWSWEVRCTVRPFYPGKDLPRTYGKYLGGLPVLIWMHCRKEGLLDVPGVEQIFAIMRTYSVETQIACSTSTTRMSTSSPWPCHCSLGPSEGNLPKCTFNPQAGAPCYSSPSGKFLAPRHSGSAKHFVAKLITT
jgi:hypothetical protein